MSFDTRTIDVSSAYGFTLRHTLYWREPAADRLLLLLPGRGYTVEGPTLYHLLYLGLENGWDVLPMPYGFQVRGNDFSFDQMPLLQHDVAASANLALSRGGYREVCVVGKSLGTPLAVELAHQVNVAEKSVILLTPVAGTMSAVGDLRTLAVIGTGDPLYSADVVRLTDSAPNIAWRIFDDLDHGLVDKNNWRVSLRALHDILEACETFLRGGAYHDR